MTGRYVAFVLAVIAIAALLAVGGNANEVDRPRMSGVSATQRARSAAAPGTVPARRSRAA